MTQGPIPSFYLYGEPNRIVDDGFVHVEALDDRSRPSEWTIQPHSHSDLAHVFVILSGGGSMRVDGNRIQLATPCFLVVPSMTVHAFEWLENSVGFVITMATSYITELNRQDYGFDHILEEARAIPMDYLEQKRVTVLISDLMRELAWAAPGHHAAANAAMLSLLVMVLRYLESSSQPILQRGAAAALVARLRERIEQRFRLRESVSSYATALGVSETALRVACAKIAGRSPNEMLNERTLLEARRNLLYSNLSISEVGYSVGFTDPAYFSRFFQRRMAMSPREYRTVQRTNTE